MIVLNQKSCYRSWHLNNLRLAVFGLENPNHKVTASANNCIDSFRKKNRVSRRLMNNSKTKHTKREAYLCSYLSIVNEYEFERIHPTMRSRYYFPGEENNPCEYPPPYNSLVSNVPGRLA